ncbi:hypothetical protein [Lapillicoccus jejuensis]|uniref:hypothetical protein n=1 Tax=Lapillicoccus jejuensis TaxID=402171 RepID=UPI001B875147|nr:hypothetical protein [Lapillicoccus jejuensis]
MVDVPRRALARPRSLAPEQFAAEAITRATGRIPVRAWVLWETGTEELLDAVATAWTSRAVLVAWGAPPHQHEAWVWAGAVTRVAPPATPSAPRPGQRNAPVEGRRPGR